MYKGHSHTTEGSPRSTCFPQLRIEWVAPVEFSSVGIKREDNVGLVSMESGLGWIIDEAGNK